MKDLSNRFCLSLALDLVEGDERDKYIARVLVRCLDYAGPKPELSAFSRSKEANISREAMGQ